jgi:hypothetical protein
MQWSRLRSKLREFVAPSVRKRIDFHLATYRKLSELANEFWVTVDGERVFSASVTRRNIESYILTRTTGLYGDFDGPEMRIVDDSLIVREIHDPFDVTSSIRTYLEIDPRLSLASTDPIMKALAMVDRRVGKRTLKNIELEDDEHTLVKTLYALRMDSLG